MAIFSREQLQDARLQARAKRQEEIDQKIGEWTKSIDSTEALRRLDSAGVAAGPIYSVADMFEDPQYEARELLQTVTINGESLKIPAIVPRLVDTPGKTEWPGPSVGSHNTEIFSEVLNLSDDEQTQLQQQGVI